MLTQFLLRFALIGAEWVLWVLVILSLIDSFIMLERFIFYWTRRVDVHELRLKLDRLIEKGQWTQAQELLDANPSMEARVVLFGMRKWEQGPEAVEDLMHGALATERQRYDRSLGFLGTIGNNAPFIGLFGTVLGIIGAFANLGKGGDEAAKQVMHAISEALVATGVGLIVAIPAVIAFNFYKARVKNSVANTELLSRTLLSHLRHHHDDGAAPAEAEQDGQV